MEFLKTKLGIASNNNSSTSDKHEQFKSECIGRAYFTGLVVGPLTFSIVYFLQNNFTNQLKVRTETSYPASGSLTFFLVFLIQEGIPYLLHLYNIFSGATERT